jgi:hypothetical protein
MKTPEYQNPNSDFIERVWSLEPRDINELGTITIWVFEDAEKPNKKLFFIKNSLFDSNYREKITGNLSFGNRFKFIEEIDTGESIEHKANGELTSESWNRVFDKRKKLIEEFGDHFPS